MGGHLRAGVCRWEESVVASKGAYDFAHVFVKLIVGENTAAGVWQKLKHDFEKHSNMLPEWFNRRGS
jgi:hypothetical protein